MGGGTLLVPLLSFLDLDQKTIQAINLVSFIPMCCVALGFHAKNKLIKPAGIWWIIVPALVAAVGGAFCADVAGNKILRLCFALFLIGVGIWQLIVSIKFIINNKNKSKSSIVCNPALTENILPLDKSQKNK